MCYNDLCERSTVHCRELIVKHALGKYLPENGLTDFVKQKRQQYRRKQGSVLESEIAAEMKPLKLRPQG